MQKMQKKIFYIWIDDYIQGLQHLSALFWIINSAIKIMGDPNTVRSLDSERWQKFHAFHVFSLLSWTLIMGYTFVTLLDH